MIIYSPRRKLASLIPFRLAALALFVISDLFSRLSAASTMMSFWVLSALLYGAGVISIDCSWTGIFRGSDAARAAIFFS